MSRVLFAWDIDGTLISTGGAGRAALDRAFQQIHGVSSAFADVSFAGRTDHGICESAFAGAGIPFSAGALGEIQRTYLPLLDEELEARRDALVLHPGVESILEATAPLGSHALLTGNWREGARRKLQKAGLWDWFSLGAFGDDSPNRNDLVPILRSRARASGLPVEKVVVIGDTEADLSCARAGGAVGILVETGWRTHEQLARLEPDLLVRDLLVGREEFLRVVSESD